MVNSILTSKSFRAAVAAILMSWAANLGAQNVQIHYDLGSYLYPNAQTGRPNMTTTVEYKGPDRYGDTFYFVDMAFQSGGAVQANWKFLRNLRFWDAPLSVHLRYDGGLRFRNTSAENPSGTPAIAMNDAFFTGATYHYFSQDRKLMLNLIAAYKYIKGHNTPHNWEGTVVWNYTPGRGVFNATGFATLWQEKTARPGWMETNYKFMSQPQFWCNLYNINGVSKELRLSIGSEIRVSCNVDARQWLVIPTLALRWNFGK